MSIIPPPRSGNSPVQVRRFTVDEYHRMIEVGILSETDRCELLDGWILHKTTRNPPHDVSLALALKAITGLLPAGWHCRSQSAIAMDDSEPEPDLAIVRGGERDYLNGHPRPQDIGLVIEVSDASLDYDRVAKLAVYAQASIVVYWIVNIPDRRIEVYTDPTRPDPAPAYRRRQDFGPADQVPLLLDGVQVGTILVADLLP
jgi:hypothetical protein